MRTHACAWSEGAQSIDFASFPTNYLDYCNPWKYHPSKITRYSTDTLSLCACRLIIIRSWYCSIKVIMTAGFYFIRLYIWQSQVEIKYYVHWFLATFPYFWEIVHSIRLLKNGIVFNFFLELSHNIIALVSISLNVLTYAHRCVEVTLIGVSNKQQEVSNNWTAAFYS